MDYSLLLSVRKVKDEVLEKKLSARMDLDLQEPGEPDQQSDAAAPVAAAEFEAMMQDSFHRMRTTQMSGSSMQ